MRRLIHGSTFSGIGAPEIAAEMLGWENAFHCEINPFGRRVLDYYFPDAESYEDITKTDFSKWGGRIDVLTGGFPCQPFSYAGKRRGSEDDRYLWPFMLKCIQQVRPTWFVGENVGGIATMVFPGEDVKVASGGSVFEEVDYMERSERFVIEEICQQLENEGYSVQPMLIPALSVGAPHRRDRVFFIAHRNDSSDTDSRDHEWLSERDEVRKSFKSTDVRSEVSGYVQDGAASDTPSQRRREIYEQVQSKLADGAEPFGNGRERNVANSSSKGLERENESRSGQGGKRLQIRRDFAGYDWKTLLPGERWRNFPTQSPVYRGNDGIPFDVDSLSIPFARWKKEALKAYGNAIVPQVMYMIFNAINEIENND